MAKPPHLLPYRSFETTLEELPETLRKHGVAVLPSVFTQDELAEMETHLWDMLRTLTAKSDAPIARDKPATWESYQSLAPMHGMLMQDHGVGHSRLAWFARQHPAVAAAFARLWQCAPQDLVTSFDGLSVHFPPEQSEHPDWHTSDWFHVDQSFSRPNYECVQGLVSLFPVREGDATLAVLVGSHAQGDAFRAAFPKVATRTGDWQMMSPAHMDFYASLGCERANVLCPAGSLVLWDSRTVHCGCLPQEGRAEPNTRCVVYVCQWPRDHLTEEELAKKRTGQKNRTMTSHWPDGRLLFRGVAAGRLPTPELTPLGRRLSGFD